MSTTGSSYSSLLNVSGGRYDLLEVWDGTKYINVAEALSSLPGLENQIQVDQARIDALEAKVESLDEEKAPLFVAVEPLHLKTDVFPQQLYSEEVPSPSATTIRLDGNGAYIEFSGGRVDVLDFTADWSVAVSVRLQGQGAQGANMATFGTGKVSLTLKVQGPPVYNSNYGQYNTSNHDLYHVAARFNSNSWRAPTDDSRLLWVYTASTRKLQYFISYEAGVYARWGNITVPETAVTGQTLFMRRLRVG